jgi:hypothetical protein
MLSRFFKKSPQDKTKSYEYPANIHNKRVVSQVFRASAVLIIAAGMNYLPEEALVVLSLGILLGGYLGYAHVRGTNQQAIRSNLAKFMQQACPNHDIELRKNLEARGQCFGLSICHAAMHTIGKLHWWEAALVELANWDGNSVTLDRKVILPDADDSEPVSLQKIFERMLNYVVQNHVTSATASRIENLQQCNLLDSNNKFFELCDSLGKIKKIQAREIAAGNFTEEALSSLFGDHLDGAICILTNEKHAINLNYLGNEQWMVYNSNYSHESVQTLHKIFSSKEAAAKEILSTLGSTIAIEVGYFNPPKTDSLAVKFAELIDIEKINLTKKGGLHKLVTSAPEHLIGLLASMQGDDKAATRMLEYLIASVESNKTGFSFILENSPDSLPSIFNCIWRVENASELIAKTLTLQDAAGWSGLHTMATFASRHLPALLDFIAVDSCTDALLRQALKLKNKAGVSAAAFVEYYAPDCVDRIGEQFRNYQLTSWSYR